MTSRMLRVVSAFALCIGALASLAILFWAGRQGTPAVVFLLMGIWVVSPFVLLGLGYVDSKRWSAPNRATLYSLSLVLAVATPLVYANEHALRPGGTARAAIFVLVPPVCWILITPVVAVGALRSRRAAAPTEP